MNIFVLDEDPDIAAAYHCDKHIVKMPIEAAQMLSTTMHLVGLEGPYKITHQNHPCSLWTRKSLQNYQWLWQHADSLGKEYTKRYGKSHKSHRILLELIPYEINLPSNGLTDFANCTPYKELPVIEAYQKYYRVDKNYFTTWKNGLKPYFMSCY